jgi:RNA polymerase sigma-70 factor (ECF subfamily)
VDEGTNLDALMARLADGDRSAFTPVFRLLWAPTLRMCMSMLKNDADAKDAAQQSMEKILSRASSYDSGRPAMPWALAIAAWECRTLRQTRRRRRETPEELVEESSSTGAEDEMARRDLLQAAVDALGHLSESDKETLMATFWEKAGSSGGATFRKRRERAVQRLRDAFKRIYGIG